MILPPNESPIDHIKRLLFYFEQLPHEKQTIKLEQYQNIMDFKLTNKVISQQEIIDSYLNDNLLSGFEHNKYWGEDEWKVLIWIVISYSLIRRVQLVALKSHDWDIITQLVGFRNKLNCQYKWLSHQLYVDKIPWSEQEDILLLECKKQNIYLKWHEVQLEMFMKSDGRYFRKSKQYRERWNNYLDPKISRGTWNCNEDIQLLQLSLSQGLKWSKISSILGNRTENQVKNRFKTLFNNFKKSNQNIKSKGYHHIDHKNAKSIIPQILNQLQKEEEQDFNKHICDNNQIARLQQYPQFFVQYPFLYHNPFLFYQQQYSFNCQNQLKNEIQENLLQTNNVCQQMEKLSIETKTEEGNQKLCSQEIELEYMPQINSQQRLEYQGNNNGRLKNRKCYFKHASIDQ